MESKGSFRILPFPVLEQVPVHLYELARKHTAHIEVLRVGLKGLIVAQDLCSTCLAQTDLAAFSCLEPHGNLGHLLETLEPLESLHIPSAAYRSLLEVPWVQKDPPTAHPSAKDGPG